MARAGVSRVLPWVGMSRSGVGIGATVGRARNRALRRLARVSSRVVRGLPGGDRAQRFLLQRMWERLPSGMLDQYLVSGYQNPAINVQSILLRHFLIRRLFGDVFDDVMDEEISFAIELNETLRRRALELGVTMGSYTDQVRHAQVARVEEAIAGRDTVFAERWATILADRRADPISVLEFACGSANDYRAFADHGLARFLEYTGVDLTTKNIANARRRFSGVRFEVGDVTSLRYPDGAFDCVIASDVFEHLPVDGMERALAQAARLARSAVVLTFFSMADIPDHIDRPKGAYHWNRLSRPRVEAQLRTHFPVLTATPIAPWLAAEYGYPHSYNRNAWTITAERPPGIARPVD